MTVHPDIKALLDQLNQDEGPRIWEMSTSEARELYQGMAAMLDPTDVPIGKVEDMSFTTAAATVPVRVYTPVAAPGGPLPCLVFYHGGGFVIGDLDTHDALCRQLANHACCKVVAVHYRRAPEDQFPAAVDDSLAAIHWVESQAGNLGIDANRLAVAGDSAGGNLAAVVSQLTQQVKGPKVCFQILIYPTTRVRAETESMTENAEGYFLDRATMDWFMDCYIPKDVDTTDPRLSPLLAEDLSGLPPAYVITAGFDPLRDEGKAYADRLSSSGVEVTYKHYDDMIHGFFNMTGLLEDGRDAVKEAAKALKAAFA